MLLKGRSARPATRFVSSSVTNRSASVRHFESLCGVCKPIQKACVTKRPRCPLPKRYCLKDGLGKITCRTLSPFPIAGAELMALSNLLGFILSSRSRGLMPNLPVIFDARFACNVGGYLDKEPLVGGYF